MPKKKVVNKQAYDSMLALKKQLKEIKNTKAKQAAKEAVAALTVFAYDTSVDQPKLPQKEKSRTASEQLEHYKELIYDEKVKGATVPEIIQKIETISAIKFKAHAVRTFIRIQVVTDTDFDGRVKKYREGLEDVQIYHKRSRLDVLDKIFRIANATYLKNQTSAKLADVVKILEQARKEADQQQNQINIYNQQNTIIQNIIAQEEVKKLMISLPLQELIVGKMASKSGTHPSLLIKRLNESIYSKFNGSDNTTRESLSEAPIYPAALLLDMKDVKKQNAIKTAESEKFIEAIEVEESKPIKGNPREELKRRIQEKKAKLKEDLKKDTK